MSANRHICKLSLVGIVVLLVASTMAFADYPEPVNNAVKRLARVLEISEAEIAVLSFEQVVWPDSSLGAPRPGQAYLQVLTPGYRVVLAAGGQNYVYHTDMGRRVVRAAAEKTAPTADEIPAIADQCRQHLAKRLSIPVDQVRVAKVRSVTFPDGSLGLPLIGEAVMKMITDGYSLVLQAGNAQYIYTATDSHFRYGGPLDMWRYSALYIEPIENEPNLNGNLTQISLLGTNPVLILSGVNGVQPQADGSIIATRRTSRSGHDLLYVPPGGRGEATKLASGFIFGAAAVSSDGSEWVAFARPSLIASWQIIWGKVSDGQGGIGSLPLPEDSHPVALYWHREHPSVVLRHPRAVLNYKLVRAEDGPDLYGDPDFYPPEELDMSLNKSERVKLDETTLNGKPAIEVARVWFNGDTTHLATLENFRGSARLTPNKRFVFIQGLKGDSPHTYTVDVMTGELLPADGVPHGASLWLVSPYSWLQFDSVPGPTRTD